MLDTGSVPHFDLRRSRKKSSGSLGTFAHLLHNGRIKHPRGCTMATRVSLGAVIGTVVSLLSLNGNRTVHGVTLFPDLLTPLVLLGLTGLAVWFCARKELPSVSTWQVARTISMTAGLIFALVMTALGILRFTHEGEAFSWDLIIVALLMLLTPYVSALVCGILVSMVVKHLAHRS